MSAGLGLENKANEIFFLVAVLIALVLTPQRRVLASRWFGVAVAIMVALALPNLALADSLPLADPRMADRDFEEQ